jgi:hypothetical protein
MATVSIDKRKRGVFGWLFAGLFWLWQIMMVAWFASAINLTNNHFQQAVSEAAKARTAIGGTIAAYMILSVWAGGSVILGLLMFATRGKKVTITRELAVLCALLVPLSSAARAQGMDSTEVAMNLGNLLASEQFCKLEYNQDAIQAFIDSHVKANDLDFPSTLQLMTDGAQTQLEQMSPSAKTAHCTQTVRVARSYGFIK